MAKKVFVSGCYDLLHSGHIAFFKAAAQYGDLYVGIGSDKTIELLKGHKPIYCEQERLFMIQSCRYVHQVWVNKGYEMIDFREEVRALKPDVFVVNEDGDSEEKRQLFKEIGSEYIVLKRLPEEGLPLRSSTNIRKSDPCMLPSRLDLAGTWIDQPYVSKYGAGWAITISLEQPEEKYQDRCGMSTSTIKAAKKIWPHHLPEGDPEMIAKTLFCFENEPGKKDIISGAQDAIGICMPGLNRHYYNNEYWPSIIESVHDDAVLDWLEAHICMVLTQPRPDGFYVLENADITPEKVKSLTTAADQCWQAILNKDLQAFAKYYQASFEAQISMFPQMLANGMPAHINQYKNKALAWKLSGAGGGGYIAFVCEKPFEGSQPIKIRRKDWM